MLGSFSGWASDERSSRRGYPRLGVDHDSGTRVAVALQPVVWTWRPVGQHVGLPCRGVVERQRVSRDLGAGPPSDRAAAGESIGRRLHRDHGVGTPGPTRQSPRRARAAGANRADCGGSPAKTTPRHQAQQGRGRTAAARQAATLPDQGRTRSGDRRGVVGRVHRADGRAPGGRPQPSIRTAGSHPCCTRTSRCSP